MTKRMIPQFPHDTMPVPPLPEWNPQDRAAPLKEECQQYYQAALPTAYDSTSNKAHTFLTECWTFIRLNQSSFPDDQVKILWALQLCSDKASNWK